jgi:hypothetical protein
MLDIPKTKQEFYESQSKEQLIIFCKNNDYLEETLRDRLFLLSGCGNFGYPDGTDGACVDCFYNNRELFRRCEYFAGAYHNYRKDKQEVIDE